MLRRPERCVRPMSGERVQCRIELIPKAVVLDCSPNEGIRQIFGNMLHDTCGA